MKIRILTISVLFAGMAFAYFLVFPLVFKFLAGVTPVGVNMATDIDKYLSFILGMFVAFGATFEVPVVVVLLNRMGVASYLLHERKGGGCRWISGGAPAITAEALHPADHLIIPEVNAAEVAGIPADDLQSAAEAAKKEGQQGWRFSLHAPSYLPVMQYAENRGLRERMYRASSTRASEFGPTELDNTPLIQRLLQLRLGACMPLRRRQPLRPSTWSKRAMLPWPR